MSRKKSTRGKSTPPVSQDEPAPERLQKVIARAGFCSRRQAEVLIESGRVAVNGRVAGLGDTILHTQSLTIDGKLLVQVDHGQARPLVIVYHKPEGELCTRRDPRGRRTIYDRFDPVKFPRLISIGRLDMNTSGLLLLTNDGTFANGIGHPSANVQREYLCRVHGHVSQDQLSTLLQGVMLDGRKAKFSQILPHRDQSRTHIRSGQGKNDPGRSDSGRSDPSKSVDRGHKRANEWYRVVLMEGRYREVRRLWEAAGVTVTRLKRIRFGNIELPKSLAAGEWEHLNHKAVDGLLKISSRKKH